MNTLNIDKEKVINAYKQGSEEQKQVLERLFGVETFRPKMVTDRIKTFNDALIELGPNHPLVKEYEVVYKADNTSNLINYSKLCIVTAALNEGWTPKLTEGEQRYLPYFNYTNGRLTYECSNSDTAYQFAHIGCHLAFKARWIANYAGKQFLELYEDYLLGH